MAGTSLGGSISAIASGIGQGLKSFQQYSGQAAARANGVSAAAQRAQGNFNQASANNANAIGTDRIAEQYGFNSGQAAMANAFTREMWDMTAAYNSEEADKQRAWLEHMRDTAYQAAVKDMEKAGLNPILAVTGGGISTGTGGGSAASISAPSGQMASGGLMNGISASEGNYTGQMEYMGGMLGLLSAALSGISTATNAMAQMGVDDNKTFVGFLKDIFYGQETLEDSGGKGQRYRNFSGSSNKPFFNVYNNNKLTQKPR